jgi:hypothetical protein
MIHAFFSGRLGAITAQRNDMPALRKVIVVFKTHFDLGFTDLPDRVMQLYTGRMFGAVREVMDATASEPEGLRYNWTLPAWPLRFLLHDPSVPEETRQAARKLVEEGRLNWHAWPFTTHTAFCGLEDLVRGLHISRSLSEEFGRWPTGAKQTDVPGHTWILPSMLARSGVKFLHLGCNSGSHAPHVPRLFWWEGPDGSRLLTYYSAGGYGTPLLPPEDWPYDTWLAVQQTVDNVGPQSPDELKRIRRTVEEGAHGVELIIGELGDFADSLLEHPEQLADLPVVPYDLADTWIHGIGTMPREVARARELRAEILGLEEAVVAYQWPGRKGVTDSDFPVARRAAPIIDAAYEQLLLFGEHTWGLDVKSTIRRVFGEEFKEARRTEPYTRLENSWIAKASYVDRAEQLYEQAWNLAHDLLPAKDLPFDGAYKPRLESLEDIGPERVIENMRFRLEVDPSRGGIVSLLDKSTGCDWVDKSNNEPFGGYRYNLYSIRDIAEFMRSYGTFFQDWFVQDFGKQGYPEDLQHTTAYARDFRLSTFKGPVSGASSLLMTGGKLQAGNGSTSNLADQTISIKIGLNPFGSSIDIEYIVEGKEATPLAESAFVPLPLSLPKPEFRLRQMGSVMNPARDIVVGANRSLWCADWIDASDHTGGLAVVPVDMPLLSIGNTGIYRFEPERIPAEPVIYAHLFNTQWGTNFPQWLEGDFRWRIRLLPHPGGWIQAEVPYWAEQYTYDIRWTKVYWGAVLGDLPEGMMIHSARPRHDGQGLIIRLSEVIGSSKPRPFGFEGPIKAIWRCDLMERPIEKLATSKLWDEDPETHVELAVAPYAIETLLIEFDKQ